MTSWSVGGYHSNSARTPGTTIYRSFGTDAVTTTTEAQAEGPAIFTGTWSLLSGHCPTNSLTTAATHLISRINGVDGNQDASKAAGLTGTFQDASNTDSVTQGDQIAIKELVDSGGSGSAEISGVAWVYE